MNQPSNNVTKIFPDNVMMILWMFVGPRCLYFKKEFYGHIRDERKEFVERPLVLRYKLQRNKERYYLNPDFTIMHGRPSMRVEDEQSVEIKGGVYLGVMMETGQIIHSRALEDLLLPVAVVNDPVSFNYPTTTFYWNLRVIKADDTEACRHYMRLWSKY